MVARTAEHARCLPILFAKAEKRREKQKFSSFVILSPAYTVEHVIRDRHFSSQQREFFIPGEAAKHV